MKIFKYIPGRLPELLYQGPDRTDPDAVAAVSDDFAASAAESPVDSMRMVSLGFSRPDPTVFDVDSAIDDGETFLAFEGREPFAYVITG